MNIFISVKQYNPNCDMLSGFRKEECQQNKDNAVMNMIFMY